MYICLLAMYHYGFVHILKDYHDYIESSFPVPLVHCSNLVLSSV